MPDLKSRPGFGLIKQDLKQRYSYIPRISILWTVEYGWFYNHAKSIMEVSIRLKPWSHIYCNLSATALWLKNNCNQCNHCAIKSCIFRLQMNRRLVWRQLSLKIGDQSVTGWWLMGDWLLTDWKWVCNWSATDWRQVRDGLATEYWSHNLLCRCNHE